MNELKSGNKKNLVIIGNGMVGYKLCEKLIEKEGGDRYNIIVFGEEPRPAYDRVQLTSYLSGKTVEDLTLAPFSWYEEKGIVLKLGEPIAEIDREKQTVVSSSGNRVHYDKLVFATGSSPFVPPISGVDRDGVFLYRTIEDLDAIRQYSENKKKAVVIGGGLLGLEAAKALIDLGLETHVIEMAPRLMPRQLDVAGSQMLKDKLQNLDLNIHLDKRLSVCDGNGKVELIRFEDGSNLETDIVVISAGIKPRDELAKLCGLKTNPRGGILVDDLLQSSDSNIYAVGEVASHRDMVYGLVAPGYEMAEVVASCLTGEKKAFKGGDLSTKLKLVGIDVASFGESVETVRVSRMITFEDSVKGVYKRINISGDGKYLLGGVLVGDSGDYNRLLHAYKSEVILPPDPSELIVGKSQKENILDLHDSAVICACENVTKFDIVNAIETNKLSDVGGIKSCTKAGTGCGGCSGLLVEILDAIKEKKGESVKKILCEHFAYTRQELIHIIKVHEIRTFDELIAKYGMGEGCEVCKPAVASMLAGVWNEKIMDQQMIQDTNDRFLANIQMGGTYSVVPRVLGGEITPDGLIVLGEVAKKYGLYCKFTGGQRMDFFGARLEQLPYIWEDLGKAGFESGHAYARGMRTVKSCAGSTWCHFGVQDSVSMCIDIEKRYKGIRFPHKVKSAVSGCVRECAEAQSKDFGIIATEKGWNLFVCGNGGIKPRHADLLATDLDTETLFRYMDRFLMYYIKTAAHLTRTSTWFEKLEGGIEHLKDVIIHDSLGICDQLEKDMQYIVDNNHCEWAELVKDSEKRSRFVPFVNNPETDSTAEFVEERGQKVPIAWDQQEIEKDKVLV